MNIGSLTKNPFWRKVGFGFILQEVPFEIYEIWDSAKKEMVEDCKKVTNWHLKPREKETRNGIDTQ